MVGGKFKGGIDFSDVIEEGISASVELKVFEVGIVEGSTIPNLLLLLLLCNDKILWEKGCRN